MEPEEKKSTLNDLHASGIDILTDTGAINTQSLPSEKETAEDMNKEFRREDNLQNAIQEIQGIKNQTTPIKNDPSIKPLRTFKSDAEEAIRYQNVSTIKIAVAEQKKKEENILSTIAYDNQKKDSHSKLIISFVLGLLILLGGGGWYYWNFVIPQNKTVVEKPAFVIQTLIPYTKGATLVIDKNIDALSLIAAKMNSANIVSGDVYVVVPIAYASSTTPMPITDIIGNTHIPSRLYRSLGDKYMFGIYSYNNTNSPFLIIKNTYFQNAFSGMLDWEKDLRNDLIPLVQVSYPNVTTTNLNDDKFEDTVVSNIDARILKDKNGNVIMAYAFADQATTVITTNTDALKFILDTLLTVRSVQ